MGAGEVVGGFYGRKGKLLLLAVAVIVAGFLVNMWLTPIQSSSSQPRLTESQWREGRGAVQGIEKAVGTWGDAVVRFGIGFAIAMVVGSLLRVFLKTMVTVLLVTAAAMAILYWQGWIDPFWESWIPRIGEAKAWLTVQTQSISHFFKGHIPSMTSVLLGFAVGLKR